MFDQFETFAAIIVFAFALGYFGAPFFMWTAFLGGSAFIMQSQLGFEVPMAFWYGFAVFAVVFNIKPIRAYAVSQFIMKLMDALKLVPKISETEKEALNAGNVWVEADFFSGKPDLKKISTQSYPDLTADEKAFIEGPLNDLCAKIDDWQISLNREIPKEIWDYMKEIKLFGMIIPKEYGGLGFSALGHSEVIMKLASRSIPVTVTAMVPNSLGPAELLMQFGTDEEKNHWLPRLASGEEIPCFALTEQRAGSDAGSIESQGVVFKKGDELWLRLNWNKRWITLAGVSTVLGLAFQLRDPDKLLGDEYDLGITCALIPSHTKGVEKNFRHDPLNTPFYNCPIQGQDVEVPISAIIGGVKNAGKGWKMLMDCLGAGRGISLPSLSLGGSKLIARVTSAHSSIRKQFGIPLCKLEGLEEPLGRIGGMTYMIDAMRKYTQGALNQHILPSVITAIAKLQSTELARKVVNDGMDIMAGTGISRGPRNLIANIYQATPIGITVEGANILTRTMIIFGQGIMRAHPWAFKEVDALERKDIRAFDLAIWGHIGHIVRAKFRFLFLSVTRGYFAIVPGDRHTKRYYQKINWASANFALLTDIAMGSLGGKLKFKEMLTGRFADIISWLYICSATLRRYEAEGSKKGDLPFVHFTMQYGFNEIQQAFDGIYANLKIPGLSWVFGIVLRKFFNFNSFQNGVSDKVVQKSAWAMLAPGETRDRLTQGIYYPESKEEALGRYEYAYDLVKKAEQVEAKISRAVRKKKLPKKRIFKLIDLALEKNIVNEEEVKMLHSLADARWDTLWVDSFSEEAYHGVGEGGNKVFSPEYHGPAGAPSDYKGSQTFDDYRGENAKESADNGDDGDDDDDNGNNGNKVA